MFLEAAYSPGLRHQIADGQRRLAQWAAPLVAGLGSSRPEADLKLTVLMRGSAGQREKPRRGKP